LQIRFITYTTNQQTNKPTHKLSKPCNFHFLAYETLHDIIEGLKRNEAEGINNFLVSKKHFEATCFMFTR